MNGEVATVDDLDAVNRRIDELERQFKEAFPHGDYAGHCRYHEIQIQMLLARRKLTAALIERTLSALIWSAMLGTGLACWHWIISQVRAAI